MISIIDDRKKAKSPSKRMKSDNMVVVDHGDGTAVKGEELPVEINLHVHTIGPDGKTELHQTFTGAEKIELPLDINVHLHDKEHSHYATEITEMEMTLDEKEKILDEKEKSSEVELSERKGVDGERTRIGRDLNVLKNVSGELGEKANVGGEKKGYGLGVVAVMDENGRYMYGLGGVSLGNEKNKSSKLENLVYAAARVNERTVPMSSDEMWSETREFILTLKDLIVEFVKSKNFRHLLYELANIMSLTIGLNPQHTLKSHHRKVRNVKNRREYYRILRGHFNVLFIEFRKHPDVAKAFKKLMRLCSLLNKEFSGHLGEQVDTDVEKVKSLSIEIVQSYAWGRDINKFLSHAEKAIYSIQNDEVILSHLRNCRDLIEKYIDHKDPILDEQYLKEIVDLVKNGREISRTIRDDSIYKVVMSDANNILAAIRDDEDKIRPRAKSGGVSYKELHRITH